MLVYMRRKDYNNISKCVRIYKNFQEEGMKVKTFRYDDVPVIETTSGKLKGYFYDGAYVFKGVPYAYADRFQMPQASAWEGVRDVTSYGLVCPLMSQGEPRGELMVPHRYWPQDEHCQNLNIWTKTLDPDAKCPVLVWLHGGGYYAGSSIEQVAYDGFGLCMYGDAVVISINHRLNILGYLDLSCFGEKYKNSGNAGNADIVAALRWIHDNVRAFGGDPDNVTVFGQSGGGMKVADLMQIEEADGLFHKALIMSGVANQDMLPSSTGDGREIVTAMLKERNLGEDEAEKLERVPYASLVQAYETVSPAIAKKGGYIGGTPLVNDYYRGNPLQYGMRDRGRKIPLMIGSVFGEFSFRPAEYDKTRLSEEETDALLRQAYGERAKEVAECFRRTYPGKAVTDVLSLDRVMRQPSKRLAKLHAEGGKSGTYLYNFVLEFPFQHGKAAWHCSDIPFFFHNTDKVEICAIPGVRERLEQQMCDAWLSFARTGTPVCKNLPKWESVTPDREPTMVFDRVCEVRENYDDELYALIDSILPPYQTKEELEKQDVQH